MNDYDAFVEMLNGANSFLIASHYNPDGDGIGSSLALGEALAQMGKEVVIYNRDVVPQNLKFLPDSKLVKNSIDSKSEFDMAIMVDCGQRDRISDDFAAFTGYKKVACIDHHILENPEADISLIDSKAASTGEVVLHLIEHAGLSVTSEIAQCIYTTLVVDTGFFRYSNTDSKVLRCASDLVAKGASPWTVAKNLDESCPVSRMKLLALVLSSLSVELGGRYASMDVTQDMLKETGATIDQSDEFATYPRSIMGVEVAALFREVDDKNVKVSIRSKDHVDVAALAKSFDGGGHARAAGFRIKGSLQDAKTKVLEAVKTALSTK